MREGDLKVDMCTCVRLCVGLERELERKGREGVRVHEREK